MRLIGVGRSLSIVLLLQLVLVMLDGVCTRSLEALKARYLDRGDGDFARKRFRDAVSEYPNVPRIEATNAHPTWKLGFTHYELGPGEGVAILRLQSRAVR